jgi:hypothetical protein
MVHFDGRYWVALTSGYATDWGRIVKMANVQGPYGFKRVGTASSAPNFGYEAGPSYRIAAGYSTAIFFGDAVRMNKSVTGFVEQWANGDGASTGVLLGIFLGCKYFSTSSQLTKWSRYWPGSDATGDVEAFVADDPNSMWQVQAGIATAITQASIGQTADVVATPTGNTTTGISGMSLSTPTNQAVTAFLPFKVVGVVTSPPGANGTDLTTPFNTVIVSFATQQYKTNIGI